jgi:hypothetical protein
MKMLKLLMKLKILSIFLVFCSAIWASDGPLASPDVVARFSEGIRAAQLASSRLDSPEREAIRRRTLDGLSDAERLRGIAEWMFTEPNRDHASIPSTALQILLSPKREIRDLSEWRRLMNLETDSSRFYMLAELSRYFEAPMFGYGESFMAERARGLLMQGVAAKQGQGQTENDLSDISFYAYDTIVSDLRKVDSPFTRDVLPTLEGKPKAAKVAELARWIKANWPGCEGLAIREKDGDRPDRKRSAHDSEPGAKDAKAVRVSGNGAAVNPEETGPPLIAMVSGCILIAVAGLFFFLRRGRTA